MQLQKVWARFFAGAILIIGLLSIILLIVFYNQSVRQEVIRMGSIEEFVRNQKHELIENIVNNMVAEISMQKLLAEENAGHELSNITIMLELIDDGVYANDYRIQELIDDISAHYQNIDIIAYSYMIYTVLISAKLPN